MLTIVQKWLVELVFNNVSNFQLLILKFRKDKPVKSVKETSLKVYSQEALY
jgi:hypothetical protein